MKIAIPLADGLLSMHFGHCESFALLDVDMDNKQIVSTDVVAAPPHEPGLLPRWLGERDVNMIITGGMGQRAKAPETIVSGYMNGSLVSGANACDSDGRTCDH
jgi:predicted Fe-Mo cluster-binding NifX family protein